jgi:hypothetical protein
VELATEPGLVSPIFGIAKPNGGGIRLIHDLRSLNATIPTRHFRVESLETLRHILPQGAMMARLDLRLAYHHISIDPQSRKWLQFKAMGRTWQYTALPFGLNTAPHVFTRMMRCVVRELRRNRVQCLFMLDDALIWGRTREEAVSAVNRTLTLLQSLGFTVHWEKSELTPSTKLRFLGVDIDSESMSWSPTRDRLIQVRRECRRVLNRARRERWPTVPSLRRLVGLLGYMRYGVMEASARRVHLQTTIRLALRRVGPTHFREHRHAQCRLSHEAMAELEWWADLQMNSCRAPIRQPIVVAEVASDASEQGAGWTGQILSGPSWVGYAPLPRALIGDSSAARELWAVREAVRAAVRQISSSDA